MNNTKQLNPEFIKEHGKRGIQIGFIFPNHRHFGFRIWCNNWGIQKSIFIKWKR